MTECSWKLNLGFNRAVFTPYRNWHYIKAIIGQTFLCYSSERVKITLKQPVRSISESFVHCLRLHNKPEETDRKTVDGKQYDELCTRTVTHEHTFLAVGPGESSQAFSKAYQTCKRKSNLKF